VVKVHIFALSFANVKPEARLQTGCSGERSKGIFASRARGERMTGFGFNLLHGNVRKLSESGRRRHRRPDGLAGDLTGAVGLLANPDRTRVKRDNRPLFQPIAHIQREVRCDCHRAFGADAEIRNANVVTGGVRDRYITPCCPIIV
jgi:hypothetical protein